MLRNDLADEIWTRLYTHDPLHLLSFHGRSPG